MGKDILKKGEKASQYSTVTCLILSGLKIIVAVYTGSVALLADAINSFSDVFASLAVFFGLKFSQKKANTQFPYGYYKAETLASLLVSGLIVFAGIEILIESINAFFSPSVINMATHALVVVSVSAGAYLFLAMYKMKIGEEIGSPALVSDGKHSLIDTASSGLVFLGIVSSMIGYPQLESVAGIIISGLIIWMGIRMGRYAVLVLLDACVKPELIEETRSIAEAIPGVEGVHSVKMRRSGPYAFGELHLETKGTLTVEEGHEVSEKVEKAVREAIPEIDSLQVHIEPRKGPLKECIVAVPVTEDQGLESGISSHVGKTPYFLIARVEQGEITRWNIEKNPSQDKEKKKGVTAAEFLAEMHVDVVVADDPGKGALYTLQANKIRTAAPQGDTLEEIVRHAARF
ncbi:MAG: cation diffusion facilitator family transporter [Theionarchaea archaeon]|nr:cation diffusion facilitator family transporter [Theionarchaea archaeon]